LADEINRTTPKTQSALLEAMNEGQVTIDGQLPFPAPAFMVIRHPKTRGTTTARTLCRSRSSIAS